MATLIIPGALQITVSVDNPDRDDLGGMLIWMSTSSGFTPGPSNLVYNGPDLLVPVTKDAAGAALVAGTTYYLVLALYSQIDPDDYDLSSEYSATPTAPTASANDITAGTMRGSNVFAGSFGTKGSTLTANTLAAAATLPLQNTADFPSSGSAVIFSATTAKDYDLVTYTGKTSTSLTGCSGALAHSSGEVVIPLLNAMIIDNNVNEMRFYGNRGDGVIEALANIGLATNASVVATFGSSTSDLMAVQALSANNGAALFGKTYSSGGFAVEGDGGSGTGGYFSATGGHEGLLAEASGSGPAIHAYTIGDARCVLLTQSNTSRAHMRMVPVAADPSTLSDGDIFMKANGRLFLCDGATPREVVKVEPSTFANVATGSTISLTAPPSRYINTGSAKAALTFNLPASPVGGQTFEICTDNAITTVAIRDSAGVAGNVMNAPTTLAAGGFCKFEYRSSNTTWYRIG